MKPFFYFTVVFFVFSFAIISLGKREVVVLILLCSEYCVAVAIV